MLFIEENLVKIINKPERITCNKCGCVFEFDNSDVKESMKIHLVDIGIILPKYESIKYCIKYVNCPICRYSHEISVELKH